MNATFFEEQSVFMNAHDIISLVGSQLTSVPFMPDSGSVLEVFPKGYFVPGFLGNLVKSAGLNAKWNYFGPEKPGRGTDTM